MQKAVHTSVRAWRCWAALPWRCWASWPPRRCWDCLNVPEDVFPLALLYLRIYLLGMPVILLYNFEAAIFRSVGETQNAAAGAGGLGRAERDAEPVLRGRAAYDGQRRGHRNGAIQCGQLGNPVSQAAPERRWIFILIRTRLRIDRRKPAAGFCASACPPAFRAPYSPFPIS